MKVWEVSREMSGGDEHSVGLFYSRELALDEVDRQIKWVENYHGPHYPVTWEQPQLSADGPTTWRTVSYFRGDQINLKEREIIT